MSLGSRSQDRYGTPIGRWSSERMRSNLSWNPPSPILTVSSSLLRRDGRASHGFSSIPHFLAKLNESYLLCISHRCLSTSSYWFWLYLLKRKLTTTFSVCPALPIPTQIEVYQWPQVSSGEQKQMLSNCHLTPDLLMLIVSSSVPENISHVINLPVIPRMKYQFLLWEITVLSSVELTIK